MKQAANLPSFEPRDGRSEVAARLELGVNKRYDIDFWESMRDQGAEVVRKVLERVIAALRDTSGYDSNATAEWADKESTIRCDLP